MESKRAPSCGGPSPSLPSGNVAWRGEGVRQEARSSPRGTLAPPRPLILGVAASMRGGPVGPMLGFDPVPRFSASCGPLVGGPPPVGWPPTLTSDVRALSAKMAGAQVVFHEGISPSGFCRLGPGSVVAWRARVRRMSERGSSNPPIQGPLASVEEGTGGSPCGGLASLIIADWGP